MMAINCGEIAYYNERWLLLMMLIVCIDIAASDYWWGWYCLLL